VNTITSDQYHALIFALAFTLFLALITSLALMARPRRRSLGQLPWRRWARRVPARHARVLGVLREQYRYHPGRGLGQREIARRAAYGGAPVVIRRMCEVGWAERTAEPSRTPYYTGRSGYRLTRAGWEATSQLPGAHLPADLAALERGVRDLAATTGIAAVRPAPPHTSHRLVEQMTQAVRPDLPDWHPSAAHQVMNPITGECTPERWWPSSGRPAGTRSTTRRPGSCPTTPSRWPMTSCSAAGRPG
jgi:hypothetical protein